MLSTALLHRSLKPYGGEWEWQRVAYSLCFCISLTGLPAFFKVYTKTNCRLDEASLSEKSEVTVESRPLPPSACFALHHCVKSVLGYCAFGHWSQLVRRAELLHRAESRADFLAVCYSDLLCCFELREIGFDACFRLHCCNGQRE